MAQRPFSGTFARNPKRVEEKPVAEKPGAEKPGDTASNRANAVDDRTNGQQGPAGAQTPPVPSDLNASLERLTDSVQHLQKAVDYRLKLDENQGELRAEFNRMNDERKRLAARLDQAEGKGQTMQQVNQDVSKRLAEAMETIRTVLENQAR